MIRSFISSRRLVQPREIRAFPIRFSTAASPAVAESEAPAVPKTTLINGQSMTPKEVVNYLDKYIIGQGDAKKAVAIAFRNRWRRQHLPIDIKNEVTLIPYVRGQHEFVSDNP